MAAKIGRPVKWSQEIIDQVRHARHVENRKIKWISERFEVPIDTVRDWIYRGKRDENTRSVSDMQ